MPLNSMQPNLGRHSAHLSIDLSMNPNFIFALDDVPLFAHADIKQPALTQAHNTNLEQVLKQLDRTLDPQVNLITLDTATLFEETITNPERSGFTNTTDPYFIESANNAISFATGSPDDFAFFGRYHPSTATHRLIAEAALSALTNYSSPQVTEQFGTVQSDSILGAQKRDRFQLIQASDRAQ